MTRWISSAFCTLCFITICFFLPVWNMQKHVSQSVSTNDQEKLIAVVSMAKKKSVQVPPIAQKNIVEQVKAKEAVKKIQEEKKATPIKQAVEPAIEKSVEKSIEAPVEDTPIMEDNNIIEDTSENTSTTEIEGNEENASEEATSIEQVQAIDPKIESLNKDYKKYVLSRIAVKKTYPYEARSKGIEGKIKIELTINTNGSLNNINILSKGESELLVNACLSAIKKAAPFKKMKDGMSAMTVIFVMDFSLDQ